MHYAIVTSYISLINYLDDGRYRIHARAIASWGMGWSSITLHYATIPLSYELLHHIDKGIVLARVHGRPVRWSSLDECGSYYKHRRFREWGA